MFHTLKLLAAMAAFGGATTLDAAEPLFPFVISYGPSGKATDVSDWLHRPAGKYGFVRNRDGRLTREEIEIDMQDARITGSAAAALAALKVGATRSNYLKETKSYTLADIDAMESALRAGQKLKPDVVKYFVIGLKKANGVPRRLFAAGGPHLTAIGQSWTSDC